MIWQGIVVLLILLAVIVVAYLVHIIVQQHYCAKLDVLRGQLPGLRSLQPAADSGPEETRWGYGQQSCHMTPRQMWKYLETQGLTKEQP